MMRRAAFAWIALVAVLAVRCEKAPPVGVAYPNERPEIELSTAPAPYDSTYYVVHFTWRSFDSDGEVKGFRYTVDPPVEGDTSWTAIEQHELELKFRSATPDGSTPRGIVNTDYHVFAIEAVDNLGLTSIPLSVAFLSYTVAPTAQIVLPIPNHLITASTPTSVTLQWKGTDPDGPGDKRAPKYKYRLVEQGEIQRALGIGSLQPTPSDIQQYFGSDGPGFAGWDSTSTDSTFRTYQGLSPGTTYYFAVLAFDEAGAYDPRFDLDRNVARFRPSLERQGPTLKVYNAGVTATSSAFDLSPNRAFPCTVPSGEPVRFDWTATPPPGGQIAAYRWVFDPVNGDLTDETPRQSDDQTYRWSTWALEERSATVGPFATEGIHFLYVEARDNAGMLSLVQVRVSVVIRTSTFLVIDDYQASPDHADGQPYGNFPTEAILDTLFYAVGGKPYQDRPPGTLSLPGVFAGFDYDTLDYRFRSRPGLPIDLLLRYKAVVIYTSTTDAIKRLTGLTCGLRYSQWAQTPNPLAAYVALGGKLWVFGDGIMYAFMLPPDAVTTFGVRRVPEPGSFPYDYMKLRSQYQFGGNGIAVPDYLVSAVPYLPANATPGRPWPPDSTRTYARGTCDEPRVGPASARNSERWDGLPCLTLSQEFSSWPTGFPAGVRNVAYVSLPNSIIEDLDPTLGVRIGSAVDTLYLWHAVNYIGGARATNPDGKPVMCAYEGADSGPVVWIAAPLWVFDREELRVLAAKVMGNFGILPSTDPRQWTGPGSAQTSFDDPPAASGGLRPYRRTSAEAARPLAK